MTPNTVEGGVAGAPNVPTVPTAVFTPIVVGRLFARDATPVLSPPLETSSVDISSSAQRLAANLFAL